MSKTDLSNKSEKELLEILVKLTDINAGRIKTINSILIGFFVIFLLSAIITIVALSV